MRNLKSPEPESFPNEPSSHTTEQVEELLRLCRAGKLCEVEAWIDAGGSLTIPAEFKNSPLEVAVETGFHSLVLLLARNERQQQIKNKALQKATELHQFDLIELLVREGARVSEVPLLHALRTRDPKIMKFYLEHGADAITGTPFSDAFCERMQTALGPIVEDRKTHPKLGGQLQERLDRALRFFCREGDLEWVSLLVLAGADPRTRGPRHYEPDDPERHVTALKVAASGESVEVLKRLKPNRETDDLEDLLVCASLFPRREMIAYLLEIGANANGKENGGSEAIDGCLWNIHFKSFSSQHSGPRLSSLSFYEIFECIKLLARRGAIWRPDDSRRMNRVRKLFYECDPDVTIEWLKILKETGCGDSDSLHSFLCAPQMKEHLAEKKWWLAHLKMREFVFPRPRPADLAKLSRGNGPLRVPAISSELRTRYNRADLFQRVWDKPVRIVAKELGVSDVALAKTCKKLYVPLPGRGYWARKAAGKNVGPRPELRPLVLPPRAVHGIGDSLAETVL
jgi:hypothetical protein